MRNLKYILDGKRFGQLMVLARTVCPKTNRMAWLCECSCGAMKVILQQSLLSGRSRSCGCGISNSTSHRLEKKIRKGSQFGKLKVLIKEKQDKWGNWLYKCQCACGKIHLVKGTDLRCGKTKSCGCGQKESVTTHGLSQTKEYRRKMSIQNAARRRAIKKGLGESFSSEEIEILLIAQNNKCHYCKAKLAGFHRDHKIPLCREGTNSIDNIALACPPCNLKKNKKTDEEFLRFLKSFEGKGWLYKRDNCVRKQKAA
ncbi:MAG TPA: HNH endonuclease [bacterium]|nr:HNH endonuclease [bacterium]